MQGRPKRATATSLSFVGQTRLRAGLECSLKQPQPNEDLQRCSASHRLVSTQAGVADVRRRSDQRSKDIQAAQAKLSGSGDDGSDVFYDCDDAMDIEQPTLAQNVARLLGGPSLAESPQQASQQSGSAQPAPVSSEAAQPPSTSGTPGNGDSTTPSASVAPPAPSPAVPSPSTPAGPTTPDAAEDTAPAEKGRCNCARAFQICQLCCADLASQ